MKRYSQHEIETLLDKFMDGQTTVEEEKMLAEYFRRHDVPAEWEDYRTMFGYFDSGMESNPIPIKELRPPLAQLMGQRWWGITAAACITAAVVGTVLLHRPSMTNPQQPAVIAQTENDTVIPPAVEAAPQQLASTSPESSVSQVRPAHQKRQATSAHSLKAENDMLVQENERLQRELADLKRRAFIIDLESNGYKVIQNEDGNIVLIDLEQEIENELNNQPTTNIPAL